LYDGEGLPSSIELLLEAMLEVELEFLKELSKGNGIGILPGGLTSWDVILKSRPGPMNKLSLYSFFRLE
jgi:hypothetical protein